MLHVFLISDNAPDDKLVVKLRQREVIGPSARREKEFACHFLRSAKCNPTHALVFVVEKTMQRTLLKRGILLF